MSHTLTQQRCLNHPAREAAARCPVCRLFFCRECVVEHDDRVLCSACLRRETAAVAAPKRRRVWAGLTARAVVSFALLWLVFGVLGEILLRLPDSYHEGVFR